jgi:hypothetical protein
MRTGSEDKGAGVLMTTDKDEKNINKMMDLASAHAYLMIARRCVDNARIRPYVDRMMAGQMGRRLQEIYDTLNELLKELHDEASEGE